MPAPSKQEVPLEERLKRLTAQAPVMLFMKGNAANPRCGFSRQMIELLNNLQVDYKTFDILTDSEVREGLKKLSNWPTYPQWSKSILAYDACIFGTIAYALTYIIHKVDQESADPWALAAVIAKCQLISGYFSPLLSLVSIILNKKLLEEMLNELVKFEEITFYSVRTTSNAITASTLISLGLFANHNVFYETHTLLMDWILPNSVYTYTALGIFATIKNFSGFVDIISSCYQTLIDEVKDVKHVPRELKNIQRAAEHLVSAAERLNTSFGPQLLYTLALSFFVLFSELYNFTLSGSGWTHTEESFSHIGWATVFSSFILHLIYKCSGLIEKAEELEHAVYRLILEDTSGVMSQEIRTYLFLMKNRPVEFAACGIVGIDYSLAGSMTAAVGTYMTILIQIGSSQ